MVCIVERTPEKRLPTLEGGGVQVMKSRGRIKYNLRESLRTVHLYIYTFLFKSTLRKWSFPGEQIANHAPPANAYLHRTVSLRDIVCLTSLFYLRDAHKRALDQPRSVLLQCRKRPGWAPCLRHSGLWESRKEGQKLTRRQLKKTSRDTMRNKELSGLVKGFSGVNSQRHGRVGEMDSQAKQFRGNGSTTRKKEYSKCTVI
jgi:hypothetical protein